MPIQEIKVGKVVYRFEGISEDGAEKLRSEVLTDPVSQVSELNLTRSKFQEVGYKPGVTDPREASLKKASYLTGIYPTAVSTSRMTCETPSQIEETISTSPETLTHQAVTEPTQIIEILDLDDEGLIKLSGEKDYYLNLQEMRVIKSQYEVVGRDPTDLELEVIAQTWSEHCKHKTFNATLVDEGGKTHPPLMSRIKEASRIHFERVGVVSAFSDNAGGMRFYDELVILGKGETHNSPVAIDPYSGSLTKNGGLYRDIVGFGNGGENILTLLVNNFAPPDLDENSIPDGCLDPKYLLLHNSRGERDYGNPMGIPTHGITLHFDSDFAPKPTSLGVAIGIIPERYSQKEIPKKADLIVTMGGATGRDGIHGATFSSTEMNADTKDIHSTAVQLGDPIVEKAAFDAIVAARDQGLIRSITDCGAGGYSSAVGEMAEGVGAIVNLEKIPAKYEGLSPWEIFLSESQERMVLAIDPKNIDLLEEIANRFDTQIAVIGEFTGDNHLVVVDKGETVGDIDLNFLHNGLPQRVMHMRESRSSTDEREYSEPEDYELTLRRVLANLNICSKEEMHRMYDQTVQSSTVMAPYVGVNQDIPSEASVVAPFPDKPYGVVTAHAANPILNLIDPYHGSKWAFAHAASKFTAAGGNIEEAAGIDNFIWPYPDEESLFDLHRSTQGLVEMVDVMGVPMVSGKDSLSSTYRGEDGEVIKAPPTLNITIFGRISDVSKTVTPDIKSIGSVICLVGEVSANLGGSAYLDTRGEVCGEVPEVDADNLLKELKLVYQAIQTGKVKSAKTIGEGGMATALSLMCIGGDCGIDIDISKFKDRADTVLFSERPAMLVEVENEEIAKGLFEDVNHQILGNTKRERKLTIGSIVNKDIDDLKESWQRPMREILKND